MTRGRASDVGCLRFGAVVDAVETLSRIAASVRMRTVQGASDRATTTAQAQLAVAYQLETERTNFLLAHARAEGEKGVDMPTLRKVAPAPGAGRREPSAEGADPTARALAAVPDALSPWVDPRLLADFAVALGGMSDEAWPASMSTPQGSEAIARPRVHVVPTAIARPTTAPCEVVGARAESVPIRRIALSRAAALPVATLPDGTDIRIPNSGDAQKTVRHSFARPKSWCSLFTV